MTCMRCEYKVWSCIKPDWSVLGKGVNYVQTTKRSQYCTDETGWNWTEPKKNTKCIYYEMCQAGWSLCDVAKLDQSCFLLFLTFGICWHCLTHWTHYTQSLFNTLIALYQHDKPLEMCNISIRKWYFHFFATGRIRLFNEFHYFQKMKYWLLLAILILCLN